MSAGSINMIGGDRAQKDLHVAKMKLDRVRAAHRAFHELDEVEAMAVERNNKYLD